MICRDPCVGAAGQTAPTNGLQPPLEMLFDVVTEWVSVHQSKLRDFYDMDNLESEHLDNGNGLVVPLPDLNANVSVDVINRSVPVVRTEIDGIIVPKTSKKNLRSVLCIIWFLLISWKYFPFCISAYKNKVCLLFVLFRRKKCP